MEKMAKQREIINLKNGLLHYKKLITAKAGIFHDKIKSTNILKLQEPTFINPYQASLDWLLDVLQYGILVFIVYYAFITKSLLLKMFAFGIIHWLTFDILKDAKNILKGNNG